LVFVSDGSCVDAKELWNGLTAAEWRPSSDEFERLRSLTQQVFFFLSLIQRSFTTF
jgi:hypothetical protein